MIVVIILLHIVATINFVLILVIHPFYICRNMGRIFGHGIWLNAFPASNQQLRWVSQVSFVLSLQTPLLYV